ncbi:MAG: hypothetical protein JO346_04140, partial [Alphaproteobacteria bacterium]|nr:hypothetical protein [Alphaproteobacteria bacterium]
TVGRNADFFDLGGDSLSTLKLMFAIEEALGVELPVTMIYAAPTVARLAAAIDAQDRPAFSPLVLIKPGEGAPLFIVHGVGGNVMELVALGRQIDAPGPVYGIQARGLDGHDAPNRSIAAMAEDYLAAIRAAFPQGPYHLAGYSSGGLTAFEMARRLNAEGAPPASLTLLDTQSHASQWSTVERWHVFGQRVRHRIARLLGARPYRRPPMPTNVPQALQAVFDATMEAIRGFSPGYFAGAMTVVVPEEPDPRMANPARIWRGRCAALHVRKVGGDHRTMLQGAHAAAAARLLSETLAGPHAVVGM